MGERHIYIHKHIYIYTHNGENGYSGIMRIHARNPTWHKPGFWKSPDMALSCGVDMIFFRGKSCNIFLQNQSFPSHGLAPKLHHETANMKFEQTDLYLEGWFNTSCFGPIIFLCNLGMMLVWLWTSQALRCWMEWAQANWGNSFRCPIGLWGTSCPCPSHCFAYSFLFYSDSNANATAKF